MKSKLKISSVVHISAWFVIIASGGLDYAIAQNITGNTVQGNLTVTGDTTASGWGLFKQGVDLGNNGEVMLNWWPGTSPVGTVTFDINWADGTFTWRDTATATTANNKMSLDAGNVLTLFKSNGAAGITLAPDSGKITLPAGTDAGIFFGGNAAITSSATGTPVFPVGTTFSGANTFSGISTITNATPSSSSTSGALTVAGGIGVGEDSWINGVRIGKGAGNNGNNTALGSGTLNTNSTGSSNSAFGYQALYDNTEGSNNSAAGYRALFNNINGNNNLAIGYQALYHNTAGSNNFAIGSNALFNNNTGSNNIAIGLQAGRWQSNGSSSLTDSQNSIYIGSYSRGLNNSDSNSIVIGFDAIGQGANTTVIGSSATTMTRLFGETNLASLRVTGNSILTGTLTVGGSPVVTQSTFLGYNYQNPTQVNSIVDAKGFRTALQVDSAITSKGYLTSAAATTAGFVTQADVDSRVASFGYQTAAQVESTLGTKNYVTPSNIGTTISAQEQVQLPTTTIQGDTVLNGKVIISVPQGDISMGNYQ